MYQISEALAILSEYTDRLNKGQLLAHIEYCSGLLYFACLGQCERFDPKVYELYSTQWDDLCTVRSVPLSMKFLAKTGLFSRQKYTTIRENLESLGLFKYDRQPPRGGKCQQITVIRNINFEALFLLIRCVFHKLIKTGMIGFIDEVDHGFSFLRALHRTLFHFDLDDGEALDYRLDKPETWEQDLNFRRRAEKAVNAIVDSIANGTGAWQYLFSMLMGRPYEAEMHAKDKPKGDWRSYIKARSQNRSAPRQDRSDQKEILRKNLLETALPY
jgi:hypothetical protein